MAWHLRTASLDDLDFARALYFESSRWLIEYYFGWDEGVEIEKFPGQYDVDRSSIIIIDGKDAGWLQTYEADGTVEVQSLYIIKDLRGQGYGNAILQSIIEEAASRQKDVTLSTAKINPARKLYERLGFEMIREEERKYFFLRDHTGQFSP